MKHNVRRSEEKEINLEFILHSPGEQDEAMPKELRSGDLCPRCGEASLDYNGLLNLACPICGYAVGGCFT